MFVIPFVIPSPFMMTFLISRNHALLLREAQFTHAGLQALIENATTSSTRCER